MKAGQAKAPILEGLRQQQKSDPTSFGVPGHKSGRGAGWDIMWLLGRGTFKGDATTFKGIDDRRMSKRVRQNAEKLAARAWGAEHCFFSTNGTSLSNHVAMLTVAAPGDTVLMARNSHKSLYAAAIIGHVKVTFLEPDYDDDWNVEHGIPVEEVRRKLASHPGAKAVFVVSPTYYGISSDLAAIAEVCHERGVPLIVDEAWGPHFAFHPALPKPAIRCGADMAVSSIHKTMAGLEGASILLLNSEIIPYDRFTLAYDLFESTSPSVPILASIDATRRQFVESGRKMLGDLLDVAKDAREQLAAIEGVRVMGREVVDGDARCALEEMKILIDITALGVNGYAADDWLEAEQKVSMSLSDERHLLATLTIGNGSGDADTLAKSIRKLADWASTRKGRGRLAVADDVPPLNELKGKLVMNPSKAFFAEAEHVPLKKAAGRIAAEMVSPYPPGIPRIVPGERITEAQVRYLETGLRIGLFAMDPSDMSLRTVRVVA
jgi:arginine decarboxylase